ncbi:MAG: tripartite tricarboxylate transporter permease [Nanoarchaeota archaeon]
MFVTYIIVVFIGLFLGITSSLIPSLHINLISSLIFTLYSKTEIIDSTLISIIIFVTAVVYSFMNFIPSIYLGAPNADTILTVLPGHRYLLKGKAHEAVILTLIGSLTSFIIIMLLFPLLIKIIPILYEKVKEFIAILLISISLYLIYKEKNSKFMAFLSFILSGLFGIVSLSLKNINEPLLPILSGLFGLPGLFISLYQKNNIPPQTITFPALKSKTVMKSGLASVISGTLFILLPGLGPSQASILGKRIAKLKTKGFMMLSGGLNIINLLLSLITFYTINKERNGPVVIISKLNPTKDIFLIILLISASMMVIFPTVFLALQTSKTFSKVISKINYKLTCLLVMLLITSMVVLISKSIGLLLLAVGFFIGLIPILSGVNRNHLMGVLILPIILFFI